MRWYSSGCEARKARSSSSHFKVQMPRRCERGVELFDFERDLAAALRRFLACMADCAPAPRPGRATTQPWIAHHCEQHLAQRLGLPAAQRLAADQCASRRKSPSLPSCSARRSEVAPSSARCAALSVGSSGVACRATCSSAAVASVASPVSCCTMAAVSRARSSAIGAKPAAASTVPAASSALPSATT